MSRTLLMCKKHSFHSVNYFMSLGFQVHLEGILVKVWKYLSAWGFSFKSVLSVNSWREERSKSQTRWWEEVLPDETRGLEARSEIDLCTLRSWVLTGQIKIKFEARDGGCKHGNHKFKGSLSYMVKSLSQRNNKWNSMRSLRGEGAARATQHSSSERCGH